MKKDLTFDDIAKIEQAIAKKYGEEAVQNPRKYWNDEKEEKYQEQLRILSEKELLNEENESAWTFIYKGMLGGFKKAGLKGTRFDSSLDSVAHAAAFLIKSQFGGGAKNDFVKSLKKYIR